VEEEVVMVEEAVEEEVVMVEEAVEEAVVAVADAGDDLPKGNFSSLESCVS